MSASTTTHQYRPIDKPETNSATYFDIKDVPAGAFWLADFLYLNKRKYYQHLADINAGRKNGPKWRNDPFLTYEANRDLIDCLTAALDLTPTQRNRARRYFLNLDREKLGLKTELVAFCLCSFLLEMDKQNHQRRCHPNVERERRDPLFTSVAENLGLTEREIRKTYGKLQYLLRDAPLPPVKDDKRDPNHDRRGGT